ncbi:MAG: hypothetical protein ACYCZH_12235 [Sulfuriferula sp.]
MKRLIATSMVLLAGISGEAMATCASPATMVTGTTLTNLVTGNTVCATRGGEKWQEQHLGDGTLWDYKKGANDPVDPTKQVGTWSIGADTITYTYTGGPSYIYNIYNNGGVYSFCTNGAEIVSNATFKTGATSCP